MFAQILSARGRLPPVGSQVREKDRNECVLGGAGGSGDDDVPLQGFAAVETWPRLQSGQSICAPVVVTVISTATRGAPALEPPNPARSTGSTHSSRNDARLIVYRDRQYS
jgi:hypothetical protein